ncbi:MAG: hypothetical protein R3C59_22595 [Planctomycetaceae bacterium]
MTTSVEQLESLGATVKQAGGEITDVSFRDSSKLGDEQWKLIGQLSHLKSLTAYGGARGLNDDTVGFLEGLKQLESLSLDGAQLSDTGLSRLAALNNLQSVSFFHLSFRKGGFTGKGFEAWMALSKLERLTVAGMSMGDEGFREIAKLKQLKQLRTWHTYRTEASNTELAKLPNLTTLKLGQRLPHSKAAPLSLSNNSLATLVKIPMLETLELSEADFSVEALKTLAQLPNLKRLKIDRTYLKAADIEKLKSKLPGVQITFEPLTDEQKKKLDAYLKQN